MLSNAIAIANGKGGVGKTSLSANLSAIAAASGWRVLAVDVDMQGNLGMDLGYRQTDSGDDGLALLEAIQQRRPAAPSMLNVRPNLDVISAGHMTRDLEGTVGFRRFSDPATVSALEEVLAPISERYDLIVFDCPPSGASVMADLALAAARGLVIPVKFDEGSLDGLELMGRRVGELRTSGVNPDLELFGIVLFDIATNETAIRAEVHDTLVEVFGGRVRVFDPPIRRSARAARDMRRDGLVSIEYERAAIDERADRLAALRKGLRGLGPAKSQAASGLADDYMAVAESILEAFGGEPSPDAGGLMSADPFA
jgi:cellulose biosynthesis protein BcsQ